MTGTLLASVIVITVGVVITGLGLILRGLHLAANNGTVDRSSDTHRALRRSSTLVLAMGTSVQGLALLIAHRPSYDSIAVLLIGMAWVGVAAGLGTYHQAIPLSSR
ncbi:MAG TPA: hypothetical protein ENI86_13805 [Acidimicrobiales bacterium]|nr:hypothetical protein [Acidimicrobiales bacterium]